MNEIYENKNITLLDILDGVLNKGVVISGDLIISVANIDLVYIDLKLLVSAVEALNKHDTGTYFKRFGGV